MSTRQFVYETLGGYAPLQALVADRIYQGESLTTANQVKPFVVYRMGNDTDMAFADEDKFPHQQFFLVYAHDEPADYSKVDDILTASIAAFRATPRSVQYGITTTRYLESSRDLDDAILLTVMRYARFQFIMS